MNDINIKILNWPKGVVKTDIAVPATAEKSLLDLIEDAGVVYPYGCRSGTCGACLTEVRQGHDILEAPNVLEKVTLLRDSSSTQQRLLCCSHLKSDLKGGDMIIKPVDA